MLSPHHSHQTRRARRALLVAALVSASAATVHGQTVSNPRLVEFDPSADHNVTLSTGQPAVGRYDLEVYMTGATAPFHTVDLGKPSPQSDGKIRFDFSSQVSAWPLPGGVYEARVSAVGPNGTGQSGVSNSFTFDTTSPPAPCTYTVSPASASAPAGGTSGSFVVTTGSGCAWSAASSAAWLTVNSGTGSGSGTVSFSVTPNTSSTSRSAAISVAGQTFTVSQSGATATPAPCTYTISPFSASVSSDGGTGSFSVASGSTCSWSALSSQAWITVTSASGTGNGTVTFSVAANNTTDARSGVITVAGQSFAVNQAGKPTAPTCSYTLSTTSVDLAASAGGASVTISTSSSCPWTATSSAAWLTVTTPSGTGSGAVSFSATANSSSEPRRATITVGGQVITVTQAGATQPPPDPQPCGYALSSSTVAMGAAGGTGTVDVVTADGCNWTASTSADWVALTSGSGSGRGSVGFKVAENPSGAPRSASVAVATQTFAVTQVGASCLITATPGSLSVAAPGGRGTVNVSASSGCGWTAQSKASWVRVSPSSGSGGGVVSFEIDANNDSAARNAQVLVSEQSVVVSQGGLTCAYQLSSASVTLPATGGSADVRLTTAASCAWSVVSNADWLVPSVTGGTGSTLISFSAGRNNSATPKTANVAIGGETLTVTVTAGRIPKAPKNPKLTVTQ